MSSAGKSDFPAYIRAAIDDYRNCHWANGAGDYDADDSEAVRLGLETAIRRYALEHSEALREALKLAREYVVLFDSPEPDDDVALLHRIDALIAPESSADKHQ